MQNLTKHVFVATFSQSSRDKKFLHEILDEHGREFVGMEWISKGLNRIFPWEIFQNLMGFSILQ